MVDEIRLTIALTLTAVLIAAPGAAVSEEQPGAKEGPRLTWTKIETNGDSGLTYESACAYDSNARRLIMFGGHGSSYAGQERHDTWLLDPETMTWTEAHPSGQPPGACCTRDLVFDESQGLTYFLGGCMYFHGWQWKASKIRGGAPPWAYDAAADAWLPMKPIGPAPSRTAYSGMAYDRDNQVVVKFGGGGCKVFDEGSTWIYDGHTNTWTEVRPGLSPKTGRLPAMTYDETHDVVLLYGADDGRSSDLWAFDVRKGEWTNRRAAAAPPAGLIHDSNWAGPVDYSLFVFDRSTQKPILIRPLEGLLRVWEYDWDGNTWRTLEASNSPPGAALTQGAYLPDRGVTILVNGATPREGPRIEGTWAFAHPRAGPSPKPAAPGRLSVESNVSTVRLGWNPASSGAERYAVFRGSGRRPWDVDYVKIGETRKPTFTDRRPPRGETLHYFVRSMSAGGEEGGTSNRVRTQPRVLREPWTSVLSDSRIEIRWQKGDEPDVAGYNVYRGRGGPGVVKGILHDGWADGFVRINDSLVRRTVFVDEVSDPEGLAYHVTAVNRRGIESGPSPWTLTIPSEVRGLRVSVEEGAVTARWLPSREGHVRGYNVYRLDSAEAEAPVKLTPEPVARPWFADATKKDRSPCVYYVAAVDARGIEGIMSFGVWAFGTGSE